MSAPGPGGSAGDPPSSQDPWAGGTPSSASPPKLREVARGVFEVFLPLPSKPSIINVYLLDCGGGRFALIDTGTALEPSRATLRRALAQLGVEPSALRYLIGTHHHPDHFGASQALQRELGATVFLHALELERIDYTLRAEADDMVRHSRRNGMPIPEHPADAPKPAQVWAGTFQPTLEIDRFLEDGEVLELGDRRLEVVWTPGHTPGHCCLLETSDRVLFVGDHLLPKITPHVGVYATGPRNPLGDFVASQEKVARLDVSLVCPAHGAVYRDHRHRARQLVAHHEYRMREMADVIRAAPQTAYGVARKAFSWVFENPGDRFQAGAAVMETIAHLQLLCARGEAVAEERDGLLYYRGR